VVTAADHSNTIREALHLALGTQGRTENHMAFAALDALLAKAENPDAAWQLALDNEKAYAIQRAEAAEAERDAYKADRDEYDALLGRKMAERDAAVRERDQARDALRQIADVPTNPELGVPMSGSMLAIARAALDALSAREEAWTHEDRMVYGDGGC
jgi:hypothetical protein